MWSLIKQWQRVLRRTGLVLLVSTLVSCGFELRGQSDGSYPGAIPNRRCQPGAE